MNNDIMNALQNLFNLPNWENRGDQGDVRQAMQALHAAYKLVKEEPKDWAPLPTTKELVESMPPYLDPTFKNCPALLSLYETQTPSTEHIRACFMELMRKLTQKWNTTPKR